MEKIGEEFIESDKSLNDIMGKVFFKMFLGVLITTITAGIVFYSGMAEEMSYSYSIFLILELAVAFAFSLLLNKVSNTVITIMFFVYSIINGITMSVIFALFEFESIFITFLGTTGLFGGLALYGYVTKKDITGWGAPLSIGLLATLVVSIVNLFLNLSGLEIIIDIVVLGIFIGLTIYDTNKIKRLYESNSMDPDALCTYGAMELYLDFINIFLRILSLGGKRRR